MKRDLDLIRLQFLQVEGEKPLLELESYPEEQRVYHMALCIEAGLVDGVIIPNEVGYPVGTSAIRLTWKGHGFLDAARNATTWKKAMGYFKKAGVRVTLPILEELLRKFAKESLLLP
jgi:hypothetical protein